MNMKKNFGYILLIVIVMFSFNLSVKADTMYCAFYENYNDVVYMVEIIDNNEVKYYQKSLLPWTNDDNPMKFDSFLRDSPTSRPMIKLIDENNKTSDFLSFTSGDSINGKKMNGVDPSKTECPQYLSLKVEGFIISSLHYYFTYNPIDDCDKYEVCNSGLGYYGIDKISASGNVGGTTGNGNNSSGTTGNGGGTTGNGNNGSGTTGNGGGTSGNSGSNSTQNPLITQSNEEIDLCDTLFLDDNGNPSELQGIVKNLVTIARILVPIMVMVLSIVDFALGVFGDEDKLKKAQSKFIKRLLIAVGFFLIPTILRLVLTIAHGIWPTISNDFCGIL